MPPVDIFDNGNHELVITAELPAVRKEDIEMSVDNNTLTLRGEKKPDARLSDDCCHRVERAYGTFSRTFTLPNTVDGSKVTRRLQGRRADHQAADEGRGQAPADSGPG